MEKITQELHITPITSTRNRYPVEHHGTSSPRVKSRFNWEIDYVDDCRHGASDEEADYCKSTEQLQKKYAYCNMGRRNCWQDVYAAFDSYDAEWHLVMR